MINETKYKQMTEQLRMTNSDEDVGNYLKWIITSDTAKEYWKNEFKEKIKEAYNDGFGDDVYNYSLENYL